MNVICLFLNILTKKPSIGVPPYGSNISRVSDPYSFFTDPDPDPDQVDPDGGQYGSGYGSGSRSGSNPDPGL